jgi:hypothetical protein
MPERLIAAILPQAEQTSIQRRTMEPILISDAEVVQDTTGEELLIHSRCAEQLHRLGLPRTLAETLPSATGA